MAAVQRRLLRLAPGGARQHSIIGFARLLLRARALPQQLPELPVQESVGPALHDPESSQADFKRGA